MKTKNAGRPTGDEPAATSIAAFRLAVELDAFPRRMRRAWREKLRRKEKP
jgi:hypothetical protein